MLRFACGLTKNSSEMMGTGTDEELLFLKGPALQYKNKTTFRDLQKKEQGWLLPSCIDWLR